MIKNANKMIIQGIFRGFFLLNQKTEVLTH